MEYVLTKAEKDLLVALRGTSVPKNEIAGNAKELAPALRAFEGCQAKGFVSEKRGMISLTALGMQQI